MWSRLLFDVLNSSLTRRLPRRAKIAAKRRRLLMECLEGRSLMAADVLAPAAQPNFVFIITDDQDLPNMEYMPRTQALLGDQGMTFENMFVTNPLCCPSHVSLLTGQYSHNTGILHVVPP